MPEDDVTVTAEFDALQQTLTASLYGWQYGSYSVSVNGSNPTTVSSEGNITIPGVNTGDSITVTFNPEDNGRIYEFYLEDSSHLEHHYESDILNNSYTFNMPSEDTMIFIRFADATQTESVSYIDENGTGQTAAAIVLTGNEPVEYSGANGRVILGEEPSLENPKGSTWYVVNDNINYSGNSLYLKGHVHLIVADGATITEQGGIAYNYLDGDAVLSLYGQTNGTGKLVSDSFSAAQLNVCGANYETNYIGGRINVKNGSLKVNRDSNLDKSVKCTDIVISGGETTINGNVECSNLTIVSGVTNITGTAYAEESITLGCSNSSDSITIAELTKHANALASIVEGQTLTDGVREYSGNDLAGSDLEAMAGKTLVRDQEHNAENMTRHAAVDPTFDAETGSYNNGNVEYYTCPTCNGVFVQDGNAFVRKTENEVITPYFRFRTTGIEGYTLCEVIGYNGADADVVIPDTVPANYPDENERDKTVTGIDHYAFKDKTFVTSVTAGNYLRGIYESAFEGCTSLKTVTVGSSLDSIGIDAFKGCTALESFTSTSLKDNISCSYFEGEDDPEEPRPAEYSFDPDTTVTFYGPHGSSLRYIPNNYTNSSFVPTDRHVDPTWTWAEDYSSATAVFNCSNTCKLNGGDNAKFTDENIDLKVTDDGAYYTASVVVDGETYTTESPCTKPSFERQSLTLDGKIGVNFFMDLPVISGVDYLDSFMTFSVKHGTCTERDNYAQNNKNTTGEYYRFTCYVNSIQMAEPITATFHFYHNGVEKTVSKEYSVKEYFEAFDEALKNGTITDENGKMENLVHALADYGHYVQPFLANERHWTLGTDYATLDTSYADNYDIAAIDVSDKAIIVTNPTGGDIEKITYSLTLDSDTAINVYFKPKAGYSGSFKATVAGLDAAYT